MTPDKSKPKPPPAPVDSVWEAWEAGALDREIDMLFNWNFYCDAEVRSLDREIELMTKRATEARKPAAKSPRKPRRRKA